MTVLPRHTQGNSSCVLSLSFIVTSKFRLTLQLCDAYVDTVVLMDKMVQFQKEEFCAKLLLVYILFNLVYLNFEHNLIILK